MARVTMTKRIGRNSVGVEWQDEQGCWYTVDPTPASITSFFGGYQSSQASRYYHSAAGQWRRLIDAVLADEFTANAVRYGGVLILIFLFTREYRRLRGARERQDNLAKRWQKLWRRFLQRANLPVNPAWTASQYAENLPASCGSRQLGNFSDNTTAIALRQRMLTIWIR